MRRSLAGAASAAAASLALCLAAPAAHAGLPIMPLTDVKPGMVCTALSVVQGLEPTTFDATVISVEGGPRPIDALIIMRFSGAAVNAAGIGQGYSGSPVSCPDPSGTIRVIGAISQGIGQYDNLVAGVTPIEAMLATPTFGEAPVAPAVGDASPAKPASTGASGASSKAKTSAKGASSKARTSAKGASSKARTSARRASSKAKTSGARATESKATRSALATTRPWGTGREPLTLSGPRGALATAFQSAAAKANVPLLISPTATRSQAAAGGLKGGDAVAASVVTGDVTAGAIGTVTYVDGDRVWAFGHPYNGIGPARLLMERAQISTIIGSPAIGDQVTYKLGSPVGPVGTVGFDGVSAIGGVLGASPALIPTAVTVKNQAGAVVQTGSAGVVDERPVRGSSTGQLLSLGAAANAGTALQRLTTQSAVGGSARACTTIFLKDNQKPLYQCVDSIVPSPTADGGVETGVADAVSTAVSPVTSAERFLKLVDKVQVDVKLRPQADSLEIVKVKRPKNVKAGKTTTLRVVVVQGTSEERREIPIKVRIPRAAAGEKTGIVVLSGAAVTSASSSSDSSVLDDLFADDSGSGGSAPRSLPALRALYTSDGESGLRAVAVPGMSGSEALDALTGGDNSDLSDDEITELAKHVKLVYELPTYAASGAASSTVTPGF